MLDQLARLEEPESLRPHGQWLSPEGPRLGIVSGLGYGVDAAAQEGASPAGAREDQKCGMRSGKSSSPSAGVDTAFPSPSSAGGSLH